MSDTFDVVVVGSGSSGGAVAARLSEDEGCRLLLLEAGPDFPDEELVPPSFMSGGAILGERGSGTGAPVPAYDWGLRSETLANGQTLPLARARMVGGTSMINGSVAVRGRPEDYERWVAAGAEGWSFEALLPVFERVEELLRVSIYPRERWLPVQELLTEAWLELGFRWHDDLNAPDAWDDVVGPWPRSRHNETRMGSLNTYIRAARRRPNFTLRADALVDRVELTDGRVTGVRYLDAARQPQVVHAGEVVLSAGAYGSAPILLRSGIGPAADVRALGLDPVADLPVGRELMDHPSLPLLLDIDPEYALMGWPQLAAVARGDGWWGIPMSYDQERSQILIGFCLATVAGPEGGAVTVASPDPTALPVVHHGFQAAIDGGVFDGILEAGERLLGTQTMRAAHARDLAAGTDRRARMMGSVRTGTHPAGGCAIGKVVDPDLRVLGVEGLRVADASVFPLHVTNNPNLTCHVVGEIAAARILQAAVVAA